MTDLDSDVLFFFRFFPSQPPESLPPQLDRGLRPRPPRLGHPTAHEQRPHVQKAQDVTRQFRGQPGDQVPVESFGDGLLPRPSLLGGAGVQEAGQGGDAVGGGQTAEPQGPGGVPRLKVVRGHGHAIKASPLLSMATGWPNKNVKCKTRAKKKPHETEAAPK